MQRKPVLQWKLNALNVVLHDEFVRKRILVRLEDGEYREVNWLGFLDRSMARYLWKGRPVKLKAERFGYEGDFSTDWTDIKSGHVSGCVCPQGAFAVVENGSVIER